ncbi:Peptidase S8/S53 domain-containing protein [Madurella fahalii]|uniref:Peptidase S8/S53 domain-containing protein n=1 Tax=Madurella fahalii TaxID=1157608 RepID=A0ABQ0GQH4_9PEZI
MRIVQAVFHNALSLIFLWPSLGDAQSQQQSRIALKLSTAAYERQQADPNFIATLIQNVQSNGFADSVIPTVSASPLIEPQRAAELGSRLVRRTTLGARSQVPVLEAWYQVQVVFNGENQARDEEPRLALPQTILELLHGLYRLPEVESVQALHPGPPPTVNPSDDPRSGNQGYLNAAPQGINARYAWGFPGGDGTGVTIVDMEQGWNLNHEDLAAANITFISGINAAFFGHGTSVIGEMLMVDNQLGGVGIVPAARGRVVSQHRDDGSYNTPAAILDAAAYMSFGDILLLEAQEYDPVSGFYFWPVEVADANYEAIRIATDLGIVVVEAGCNGGYDLDAYVDLSGQSIFDRSSTGYRESGATMVGASSSSVPHTRLYFSNYGSRIDIYAWGEAIDTANTDDLSGTESTYTTGFGGTSGASPMVVGAAAIIQGVLDATIGSKASPLEVREVLATGGTPSADPASDRIGVMPNLQAIVDSLVG